MQHTNRLIDSTSPYLLQHAHNPVDWRPWGEEALALARAEDRPIFLSIGYSSCHWCHVMEKESYEDEATAAVLNEHFVSIKVDREERPDLDELYMTAVQVMAGQGGWPLNVFLTPDLKPFYGGTYFPPEDRMGLPGFRRVLRSVAEAYRKDRAKIQAGGDQMIETLRRATALAAPAAGAALDARPIDAALRQWGDSFDAEWGGFGRAPKFPQATVLRLLMARHLRTGDRRTLDMVTVTLDRMARGGMYDQAGGGFHRYSVDSRWLVPHFEKMLYDNALLAVAYMEAYQLTGNDLYSGVAGETLDYLLREMADPRGGFHSAQDADTDGEEGKFYVWTPAEFAAAVGPEDADLLGRYYGVTAEGNFEGKSILHVPVPPEEFARRFKLDPADFGSRIGLAKRALLDARQSGRTRPGQDDKVLADWNALAISALARGYRATGSPRFRDAAVRAARFILAEMTGPDGLRHAWRGGRSHTPAFLDDHAFLLAALVDLYEATYDSAWICEARTLADRMNERFWDAEAGGFFGTPAGQSDVLLRLKRGYDGPTPSGNAAAALALLRLARLTDHRPYADRAEAVLRAFQAEIERAPTAAAGLLLALDWHLGPVQEIAVVGPAGADETRNLLEAVGRRYLPHAVTAHLDPSAADAAARTDALPLLRNRPPVSGHAAAYVCENFACRPPVLSAEALADLLPSPPR